TEISFGGEGMTILSFSHSPTLPLSPSPTLPLIWQERCREKLAPRLPLSPSPLPEELVENFFRSVLGRCSSPPLWDYR
ncbi:MAG: hypothetical protein AB4426_15120, partial [Xenococcaceae cyanobacterium]